MDTRSDLQGIQLFLFSISGDDLGAFLKECQSHGAPQTTRAACHQNHFPLEFRTHQRTSPVNLYSPLCSISFATRPVQPV